MLADLQAAWRRSDQLFSLLKREAWHEQPIALRQPFVFYLGHLPAFAWNQLGRGVLRQAPFQPDFDTLFERGIDPVGVDRYTPSGQWPSVDAIAEYRDRVRRVLSDAAADPGFPSEGREVGLMVLEHELMHHETLLYMVQELAQALKSRPADGPDVPAEAAAPSPSREVEIPEGEAVLGARRGSLPFGWDNEFPEHRVPVRAFRIDESAVTNVDFLEFVRAGGYRDARLWRDEDWAWRTRHGLDRPHGWRQDDGGLRCRTLFEDVPFDEAAHWPARTSWAEANAYARWRNARLPTEAEWHRAAYGRGVPRPRDTIGHGWEWTSSAFGPFPGFEPTPRYPGYSADFFDGRHFVLRGASWATDARLVRPSFRNWFQPHYPYVFSKFRCVTEP